MKNGGKFFQSWKELRAYEKSLCRKHKINNVIFVLGGIAAILAITAFTSLAS